MKNKYLPIVLLLNILLTQKSEAQKLYTNLSFGYGIPVANSTSGVFSQGNLKLDLNNIYTYETLPVSLSSGFHAEISAGYKITPNLAFEIGYSLQKGNVSQINWKIQDDIQNSDYYTKTWRVAPSIVLILPKSSFDIYAKFGVNFGKGTMYHDFRGLNQANQTETIMAQEIKMNQSIGFHSGFGVDVKLNRHFSMNSEINLSMASLISQSLEITKYTIDGEDHLGDLTVSQKKSICKDAFQNDPNAPVDWESPSYSSKSYYSFNQIGIRIGVRYSFL